MVYMIIAIISACIKVISQGFISRKKVSGLRDALTMNAILFGVVSVGMAAVFLRRSFDARVLIYAAVGALFTVAFQALYTYAFSIGPICTTNVISNFSILIPVLIGILYYQEQVGIRQGIGFLLMVAAFILIPGKKAGDDAKVGTKWLVIMVFVLLCSGGVASTLLILVRSPLAEYKSEYLIFSYLMACLICLPLSRLFPKNSGTPEAREKAGRPWISLFPCILLCGFALGVNNYSVSLAVAALDAALYYPITNVAVAAVVTAFDVIVFRARLSRRTVIGLVCGTVAVVVMNL